MSRPLAAVLVGALALVAGLSEASGAGRARWGGTIRLSLPPVGAIDPRDAASDAELQLVALIHQPLFGLGADGRPRPVLLRSIDPAGGADLACTLADEARFHDGRPVTSEDVQWSLARLGAGPPACPARVLAEVLRVEVVDRSRFVLRLRAPVPPSTLERLLALPQASVLPKGGDGSVGAGPFAVTDRDAGGALTLGPHLAHPDGRPFVDRVEITPAASSDEPADRLYYGDADVSLRWAPRLSGVSGVRRVDGPVVEAVVLWPADQLRGSVPGALAAEAIVAALPSRMEREAVAAAGLLPGLRADVGDASPPGAVVIGLQEGDAELLEVAAVLRDVAIHAGGAGSRVAGGQDPDVTVWLGVRRLSGPDPLAAALQALGATGAEPRALRDLATRVTGDDDAAARRALGSLVRAGAVAPLLHLRRAAWVRGRLRDVRFDGHGALDLAGAWWEGGR